MRRSVAAFLITAAAAATASAESLEKANVKVNGTGIQSCNSAICKQTIKVKGSLKVQTGILTATTAQFGPTTEISVEPVIVSSTPFVLGDDPNYSSGDTSASFEEVVSSGGMILTISTKLSWKNGKFVAKQKIKASGSTTEPHVSSLPEKMFSLQSNTVKINGKTHTISILPCGISAHNGGPAIYEVMGGLLPDSKTAVIEEQKGTAGEFIVTNQVSFKGKTLVAAPSI